MPCLKPSPVRRTPDDAFTSRKAGAARIGWLTWLGWLGLFLAGALLLVRLDIAERREAFRVEARTAHRLLSQQAAQNDAVLATLSLMEADERSVFRSLAALPRLYPQIVDAFQRGPTEPWPDAPTELVRAEASSAAEPPATRHAVMTALDPVTGHYGLVLAGERASHALRIDARRLSEASDWPLRSGAPVEVRLLAGGSQLVLQAGVGADEQPFTLTEGFVFEQPIEVPSQPLTLSIRHATGPAAWPWWRLLAWGVISGLVAAMLLAMTRARQARRRAAEVARLARVSRLDSLGELAAGIAHELNQPLAAVLASTQAALRVLPGEDATDAALARQAMTLAAAQARRAADVLSRMRRLVDPARTDRPRRPLRLDRLVADLLSLMAPEIRRRAVTIRIVGQAGPAFADPTAVEQILHNLISNALQALDGQPGDRQIDIVLSETADRVRIAIRDNGPGIAEDVLPRVFEPFFTTRPGGLGLGLALCESLARAQGGQLDVGTLRRGAEFVLSLARPDTSSLPDRPGGSR